MISVDSVVEVDPVKEEDASGKQEGEGKPEEQSAELAFEDARGDAEDKAGELEGESDDQTRNGAQIAIFIAEHRGEDASSVIAQILGVVESIGEEDKYGDGGHKGYA